MLIPNSFMKEVAMDYKANVQLAPLKLPLSD